MVVKNETHRQWRNKTNLLKLNTQWHYFPWAYYQIIYGCIENPLIIHKYMCIQRWYSIFTCIYISVYTHICLSTSFSCLMFFCAISSCSICCTTHNIKDTWNSHSFTWSILPVSIQSQNLVASYWLSITHLVHPYYSVYVIEMLGEMHKLHYTVKIWFTGLNFHVFQEYCEHF